MSPVVNSELFDAQIRRREDAFDAIRLSRRIGRDDLPPAAALVAFPTSVVDGSTVVDIACDLAPGVITPGAHRASYEARTDTWTVRGTFAVVVGQPADVADDVPQAGTTMQQIGDVPSHVVEQLPRAIAARPLSGAALVSAARRAHVAAEVARRHLIDANRGLVRSVVSRYRGVVRAEACSLEIDDLMIVGDHQLLDVVERHFTDPDRAPRRDVAWSKLVQRAVGGAVRAEIARATGISVEFRQLLAWFHAHPGDRALPAVDVARKMAFGSGVTRLAGTRGAPTRTAAIALLERMLADGRAAYVPHGPEHAAQRAALRDRGVFVLSPRSSVAEIERARSFRGAAALIIDDNDADDAGPRSPALLAQPEAGFDRAETADCLRRTIVGTGMSPIEALVWLHRSGALDPGGHGSELPDIAADLGLSGRAEARAALRRARRKLDNWTRDLRAAV